MKKFLRTLLSILFITMETLGWFFLYAWIVFFATDGAMCGRWGVMGMLAATALSTFGLFVAVLKWG